jgi:hypothetical protein
LKEWASKLKQNKNFIFDWMVGMKTKINLTKKQKIINQKNKDQNWDKKNNSFIKWWN